MNYALSRKLVLSSLKIIERKREFSLLMKHMNYGIKKKKKKNYGKLIIDVSAKTRLPQTCLHPPRPRVLFVNKHQHVTHNIIYLAKKHNGMA